MFLYDPIVADPEGIVTGGHDNKSGRTMAVYKARGSTRVRSSRWSPRSSSTTAPADGASSWRPDPARRFPSTPGERAHPRPRARRRSDHDVCIGRSGTHSGSLGTGTRLWRARYLGDVRRPRRAAPGLPRVSDRTARQRVLDADRRLAVVRRGARRVGTLHSAGRQAQERAARAAASRGEHPLVVARRRGAHRRVVGRRQPPDPSVADAFYLAFFPLAYVGVVMFIRGESRRLSTPQLARQRHRRSGCGCRLRASLPRSLSSTGGSRAGSGDEPRLPGG